MTRERFISLTASLPRKRQFELVMWFDSLKNRTCTNCKWIQDEVCVKDESRLCADFVSDSDICKLWEQKQ